MTTPTKPQRTPEEVAAAVQARRELDALEHQQQLRRLYEKKARQEAAVHQLATPPLYQGVTLEQFRQHGPLEDRQKQATCIAAGHRYLAQWPDVEDVLLLTGTYGSGKGHWVWSIAQHLAATEGVQVRVHKLADIVRDLRASWRTPDAEAERSVLRRLRGLDLLVIDEVSRHSFYGEPTQHLYDLIDHRIEHRRPTILTSNEPLEVLREILGPAVFNRLEGHAGLLDFGNASWRTRHARGDGDR
jgi:DNA replication protein DnaC